MANYQMGFMTSFTQGNFEQVNDRNHFPGLYAQDSWKATPRLTINYGVRWEDFAPWANNNGNMQEFSASAYAVNQKTTLFSTLPAGMLLTGDPGVPKNSVNSKYAQFMPRVGFAYDIFGDGKTVVRGGAGIFYQDRLPGFFNLSQASWVPNNEYRHAHQRRHVQHHRRRQPRRPIQRSVLHHNRLLRGRQGH